MKYLLIGMCILLTGCATVPDVPKEVYIPVAKNCTDKTVPKKPILCVDSLTNKESTDIILNCALKDINTLEIYSSELELFICN